MQIVGQHERWCAAAQIAIGENYAQDEVSRDTDDDDDDDQIILRDGSFWCEFSNKFQSTHSTKAAKTHMNTSSRFAEQTNTQN